MAGLIEIWPTEKPDAIGEPKPWLPLEEPRPSSTVVRLAARIADTIDGWLQIRRAPGFREPADPCRRHPDPGAQARAVRAAMVSALKARGIRVAGADRLVLTEQIAVQDLMALGDFLLLPEDDLALATVLKSPLFGLDDDDLLRWRPERTGALWQAVDARFGDAAQRQLRRAGSSGHSQMPPFEFYVVVAGRRRHARKMLARLGAEAADAIDEFLNLALALRRSRRRRRCRGF